MDVEIWSDIACPWCYVGKRRFESALAGFEHRDDVNLRWRSFELDPAAPAARERSGAEHLAEKYGISVEEARARQQSLREMAAADGIDMRSDLTRGGNTFDGHRLLHLAAEHGLQTEMKERLMRAHHTEGELVSDHETLVHLADEVGVPAAEVRELLAGDRFAAEVRDDEELAAAIGIQAVPTFVVDRRIAVAGAQPPEVLLELLRRGVPVS
jgi:predicted DsbA family dithiol-disulfide isomerase